MMIKEEARQVPVIEDVDICVLGGSMTGVFAALRAARLGARVAIVERSAAFGGCITNSAMCKIDTLFDTTFEKQIIAGLTQEVLDRLSPIPYAVDTTPRDGRDKFSMLTLGVHQVNSEELKIELDTMILEAKTIIPYLHTFYAAPHIQDGQLKAVLVENKSGRGAICAKYFIDATADGDLCMHLGAPIYYNEGLQPATTTAKVYRWSDDPDIYRTLLAHPEKYGNIAIGWSTFISGFPEGRMLYLTNVDADCAQAMPLTYAEMEGRKQMRGMMDVLRAHYPGGNDMVLLSLSSHIGVRETRQVKCAYQVTFDDLVYGKRFNDAVVNCSYPPDIHHHDKPGCTFWYQDGTYEYCVTGKELEIGRWRPEEKDDPTFWQVPYRSMIPQGLDNVIVCGRAIDADKGAFSATRSVICTNQTGEAAGVAAYIALSCNGSIQSVDTDVLRSTMAKGGSIVL